MRTMDFYNYRVGDMKAKLQHMGVRPLDVMMAGVTGAGKSTTLNAFFQKTVAKVGDEWTGDHGSGRIYA